MVSINKMAPNNGRNMASAARSVASKDWPGFTFDDTFNGAAFNSNYARRKSSTTAVNLVPVGTAVGQLDETIYELLSAKRHQRHWTLGDLAYTSSYATPSKVYAALPGLLAMLLPHDQAPVHQTAGFDAG